MPSRNDRPPDIWDAHGISGNVFANPAASSSAPYPQESNPWVSNVSEHTSPHVMSESETPVQDQRCQSGPSATNSFVPSEGRFSKNHGADQQRLQTSDPHFERFPTPATFACWKIRFKTEVCTCSQFPTKARLWIKEVEMVELVDDLESSYSIRGIWTPDFKVLDAKIASALNRGTKSPKRGPFPSWKTDRLPDLRIILGHWSQRFCENYADLFTIVLRNDDIQEFDSKWDGILLSMTKIPSDDILEGLYKLRIRESEKLKTVWKFYNVEIHPKKARPDYHRLKTMVKRSIEQSLRIKNFEARNGNYETNAVVKNQETKQRAQRTLGDCWQWKANGQCSEGDNCSFWHDLNKRAKSTQPNPSPRSSTRQNERNASRTRSPRGRSPSGITSRWPCKDCLRNLHHSILWKVASSRMLSTSRRVLQIWREVLLCASPGRRTAQQKVQKEWWQKCSGYVEEEWAASKNGETRCIRLFIKYTTIGLRTPGYGAAEVFIDFAEELKHTETNPMCSIHKSCRTSC